MARITNEVLYAEIKNIKEIVDKQEKNDTEQWKVINKNCQDIASHKSIIKIIEGFLVAIVGSIIAYVWKGNS